MTNQELMNKIKAMCEQDKPFQSELQIGWNSICDAIENRALNARLKPKSFEVHHECEVARKNYLTAVAEGKNIKEAELISLSSVGF